MKLRDTGQIRRRAKRKSVPWLLLIVIVVVGYGAVWLYNHPPNLPSFTLSMPEINLPFTASSNQKLIVLYIPGMDFTLMNKWIDDLPHVLQLCEQGKWQEIETDSPMISMTSWSRFATGSDLYDVMIDEVDQKSLIQGESKTDAFLFPNSFASLPVKEAECFWTWLESNQIPTLLLDSPVSDPAAHTFQSFLDETSIRQNEILQVLENGNEQCIVAVWHTAMRLSRNLYPSLDEEHPLYDIERSGDEANRLKKMYIHMDGFLHSVMDAEDPIRVLLVSDHGVPSAKYQVNVNTWLWKHGYLVFNGMQERTGMVPQDSSVPSVHLNAVDWSQTKAYSYGMGNLFINKKNREPNDVISRDQVESVRQDLQRDLEAWRDHRWITSGEPVVRSIEVNEIDDRQEQSSLPDIELNFYPNYTVSYLAFSGMTEPESELIRDINQTELVPFIQPQSGLLLASWNLETQEHLFIADVAPVILQFFDINVPEHMKRNQSFSRVASNVVSPN